MRSNCAIDTELTILTKSKKFATSCHHASHNVEYLNLLVEHLVLRKVYDTERVEVSVE